MSRAASSETSKFQKRRPLVEHKLYVLEAVGGKGVANVFYREYEQRQKAAFKAFSGSHADFRFHDFCLQDVVFFLIRAAVEGVVGNLAYDALKRVVASVRKPKLEGSSGVSLSAVVNRRSYNRERRKKHPGTKGTAISTEIQREVEKQYKLFVSVSLKHRKKR